MDALALALAAGYAGIAFLMEAARPQAVPPTFRKSEAKRAEQGSPAAPPRSRGSATGYSRRKEAAVRPQESIRTRDLTGLLSRASGHTRKTTGG